MDQKAVHGSRDPTDGVLEKGEPGAQLVGVQDERAADDVRVAAEVLGHRVGHDVRAEGERPLKVRRRERVVDARESAVIARDLRDRRNIRDPQERIGRALDPHELRLFFESFLDRVRVGRIDESERKPEALVDLRHDPVRAAVEVISRDDVIARRQKAQHRVDRGHARREAQPVLAALELGERLLERRARRIARARVLVALGLRGLGLDVGRGEEDGRHDRARDGLGLGAGVDGEGAETLRRRLARVGQARLLSRKAASLPKNARHRAREQEVSQPPLGSSRRSRRRLALGSQEKETSRGLRGLTRIRLS